MRFTFRKDKPSAPPPRCVYNLILDSKFLWISWSTPGRHKHMVSGDYQKYWHIWQLSVFLPLTSEPKLFFRKPRLFLHDIILGFQKGMMVSVWTIILPYPFVFLGWFIYKQACDSNTSCNVLPEAWRWSVLLLQHCQTGVVAGIEWFDHVPFG